MLSLLATHFGKPVSVEPRLYEFGSGYFIEPMFSVDDALAKICVEPRDYGSGSYLSQKQYDAFFRLLSPVKPLGRHREDLGGAFAHGGRSWKQQRFENAYVTVAEPLRPGSERRIAAVCAYYVRPVTGIIHFSASANSSSFALICIDGAAYIAPREEQAKLRQSDEEQTVRGAGPTGDALTDCRK